MKFVLIVLLIILISNLWINKKGYNALVNLIIIISMIISDADVACIGILILLIRFIKWLNDPLEDILFTKYERRRK